MDRFAPQNTDTIPTTPGVSKIATAPLDRFSTPTISKVTSAAPSSIDRFGPTSAPQPSLIDKAKTAIGKYADESAQTVLDTGNAIIHPIETIKKLPGEFIQPLKAGIDKATEGDLQFQDPGFSNKIAGIAKIISGTAQSLFSPITGAFDIAKHVPGLKQVADAVNLPFTVTGFAGSFATGKAIDWIPDAILPQSSKDIIKAPLQELGALAGQVFLGGKLMEKIGAASKDGPIDQDKAQAIVDEAKAEVQKEKPEVAPEHAPKPEASESTQTPAESTQISPELPPQEDVTQETPQNAPVDRFAPTEAPAAQSEAPIPDVNRETSINSNTAPGTEKVGIEPGSKIATPIDEAQKSQAPEFGQKQSKIGKSIEAKAIESKLTEGFKTTAGFDPITIKGQANMATDLINNHFDDARDIIKGNAPLPDGLRGTSVITAMEQYIKNNPNGDPLLAEELANSHLVSATSAAAQEMRLMAERDPDSATAKFQEIKNAREEAARKRYGKDLSKAKDRVVDDIKKEIKKATPRKQDWSSFIESIKC